MRREEQNGRERGSRSVFSLILVSLAIAAATAVSLVAWFEKGLAFPPLKMALLGLGMVATCFLGISHVRRHAVRTAFPTAAVFFVAVAVGYVPAAYCLFPLFSSPPEWMPAYLPLVAGVFIMFAWCWFVAFGAVLQTRAPFSGASGKWLERQTAQYGFAIADDALDPESATFDDVMRAEKATGKNSRCNLAFYVDDEPGGEHRIGLMFKYRKKGLFAGGASGKNVLYSISYGRLDALRRKFGPLKKSKWHWIPEQWKWTGRDF